jgi:hypothetical protein
MTITPRRALMLLSFLALAACGGPVEEPVPASTSQELSQPDICPSNSASGCADQPKNSACVTSTGATGSCVYTWFGAKQVLSYCVCH